MGEAELRAEIDELCRHLTESASAGARALGRSPAMLHAAEAVARVGSFSWNAHTREVIWSDGLFSILGLTGSEAPSPEVMLELIGPEDRKRVQRLVKLALRGGSVKPLEFEGLGRDGRVLRLVGRVWAERTHEGRLESLRGAIMDVTERRQVETRLRHAQKMEAIGTLAGGVAHDFNNFLQVIMGSCEIMTLDKTIGPTSRAAIEQIRTAAARCHGLTQSLLAFGRKQEGAPALTEMAALVSSSASMIERLIGEDIQLSVTALRPCLVRIDPLRFEQVLVNLAVNARDAMPHGGHLDIQVEQVALDTDPAELMGLRPGPHCRISVRDTGCGMPPHVQERAFEPFFTTKPHGVGTGLGLATAHGIVSESRGSIQVESIQGRGTCFTLLFPASSSEPQLLGAAVRTTRCLGGTETILLVEDGDAVRAVTAQQLESGGYRVRTAASGVEALALASDASQPLDLVLSDVMMPEMNGTELAEKLRLVRPGVPVVFMSGYTERLVLERANLPLNSVSLKKPFSTAELLSSVRHHLDQRTREPMPPPINPKG